jgi:N4-gp56 family major capsid protein
MLTHLAGARGFHDNIEWRLPTEAHPQFAEFAINEVKAPTRNRHFVADGDAIKTVAANAGELDIASTDVLGMDVVDSIRTTMESIPLPPPAIKIPEDKVAEDSPLRVLLVSPAQYHAFAQDPGFRQFQANALARASKANNHPLFLGEVGLWNGILICKMPKPIRFYAGDTVRYCASYETETESTCIVPASFGTTHAVDRAILLGGQSLAQAFGKSKHGGMPFFWSEKDFDHGDKLELLIGAIMGVFKIRWLVSQGNGKKHFTDHGATAIDTAVRIIGERN